MSQLVYDTDCRMWRATVPLVLKDMKRFRRSTYNLIDEDQVNEWLK